MGREMGGGFMFGNACTPVVDSCQCMAKPIQYCKVNKVKIKIKKKKIEQLSMGGTQASKDIITTMHNT